MNRRFALLALWLALLGAACSIELSDRPSTPRPVEPTAAPGEPTAAAPLPWAALDVHGRLVYVQPLLGVSSLDLDTGVMTTLFKPENTGDSWLSSAAVSPDGQTLVVAYAPPPPPGQPQYGYSALYLMPADGSSAPVLFLSPPEDRESLFTPLWSTDGRFIYYARLDRYAVPNTLPQQYGFTYVVERVTYPAPGAPEVVLDHALWPRLSQDGTLLAYIEYNPDDGSSRPTVASPDGSGPRAVPLTENFVTTDAPLFTPDKQALILSAVTSGPVPDPAPAASSWLERLLGEQTAQAHNLPSDWWLVPLDGATPTQLTFSNDSGLFGAIAPDGRHMAYGSNRGLFIGRPDGSDFLAVPKIYGVSSVDWAP